MNNETTIWILLFLTDKPASDYQLCTILPGKKLGIYHATKKGSLFPARILIFLNPASFPSIYKPFRTSFLSIKIQSTGAGKIKFDGESQVVIMFCKHRFVLKKRVTK